MAKTKRKVLQYLQSDDQQIVPNVPLVSEQDITKQMFDILLLLFGPKTFHSTHNPQTLHDP